MDGAVHHRLDALSGTAIDAALAGGLAFLSGRRDADGLWRDFETLAGRAADWVTGYVLVSVGDLPGARGLTDGACAALVARQHRGGGWGYNERIPPDADSTAWALRSLMHARWPPPHAIRSAFEFLRLHQQPDGGFATFRAARPIGRVIGEPDDRALDGWRSAHACVTAIAALALLEGGLQPDAAPVRQALSFLDARVGPDGLVESYWWAGPTYATYHAMRALAAGGCADAPRFEAAADGLIRGQNADGGWSDAPAGARPSEAFASANGLLAVLLAPSNPERLSAAREAAAWLLARQAEDGSWPAAPILRIPDAHVTDPDRSPAGPGRPGTGVVVADDRRCFTTATALHALHRYAWISGARGSRP